MSGAPDVVIRDLSGMREFRAAEVLQRAVWGEGDMIDPGDLMMVIQQEGGLVAGAFLGGNLLGYVFAFPTVTPGIQHSHRLAVDPLQRGTGLGVALKWYQRDWCLARGIGHVRWTFDPLRHANANLNIARLGAVAQVYHPDYYGKMAGINQGAPSDRLLADWWLESPRVAACAAGLRPSVDACDATVTIPRDFGALLADDPEKARAIRHETRAEIERLFREGNAITGYDPGCHSYILTRRSPVKMQGRQDD